MNLKLTILIKGDGSHTVTKQCSLCLYKDEGSSNCDTSGSGGTCSKCGGHVHEKERWGYYTNKTKAGHEIHYACTFKDTVGCSYIFKSGKVIAHTGGIHENEGKCEDCKYVYQTHSQSEIIKEYKETETGHIPVYTCTESTCTSTYDGEGENHTGGTHDNDGMCEVCEQVYQSHSQSEIIKEYKKTETGHIPVYTCTESTCTSTYDGTEEAHLGGEHANDGKCTVEGCGYQYQNHSKSEIVKEYNKIETGHTPVYTCTHSGCTATYNGTETTHTVTNWTDNSNGTHSGNCTTCNYRITKEHQYEDGECKDCKLREPEQQCLHSYTTKSNNTQHWEECTKCNTTKPGSLQAHTYGEYIDNRNGTHSATCTVCNYRKTEEHNYEDNECKECKSRKQETEQQCAHSYTTKGNGTQHWEECTKCELVKTGTLENHNYGTYIDNENGTHSATCVVCNYRLTETHNYENGKCEDCETEKKENSLTPGNTNNLTNGDSTTSDKDIPKTGIGNIMIVLIAIIGIAAVVVKVKMKEYKDI